MCDDDSNAELAGPEMALKAVSTVTFPLLPSLHYLFFLLLFPFFVTVWDFALSHLVFFSLSSLFFWTVRSIAAETSLNNLVLILSNNPFLIYQHSVELAQP